MCSEADYESRVRVWMGRLTYLTPATQLTIGMAQAAVYGLDAAPSERWAACFLLSCIVAWYCRDRAAGREAVIPGPITVGPESDERTKKLADSLALFVIGVSTLAMVVERPSRSFLHMFL